MSDTDFDARLVAEWQDTSRSAVVPSPSEVMARGGPDHASRTAVIAELEEVRVLVEEVVESLDADRATRLATRLWTVLDVLAHVASWAHETRVEAERLLSDQSFDEMIHFGVNGPHVWNQREVDARRGHTPAQLLAEIDVEHRATDRVDRRNHRAGDAARRRPSAYDWRTADTLADAAFGDDCDDVLARQGASESHRAPARSDLSQA